MRRLTLTQQEQARLQTLNLVLGGEMGVREAASLVGLSERHAWRILAAYRKDGAAALSHGNRGRRSSNALPEELRHRVVTLARSTVRQILRNAGIASPRHRRPPRIACGGNGCRKKGCWFRWMAAIMIGWKAAVHGSLYSSRWMTLPVSSLLPCSANARILAAVSTCSKASSGAEVSLWRCTLTATPSFSTTATPS